MENQEKKHKRRVRYSGAYPKNYREKYKELQPEKYADTILRLYRREARLQECISRSALKKSWISSRYSRGRPAWMQRLGMAAIRKRCWNACSRRAIYMRWM